MSALRYRVTQLLISSLAVTVPTFQTAAIGIPGQRLAAEATLAAVPDPLRGFFATRVDGVIERTLEPDAAWPNDPSTRQREEWHYLALDAAAGSSDWDQRLQAARVFPPQANLAQRLFREHDTKHGGKLPWELEGLVEQLAGAFRAGDAHEIVRYAGYVIHFSVDAADPFATTRDRRSAESGNPVLAAELGDRGFVHQDAARRIGWELIRRNAERIRTQLNPQEIRFELGIEDVPFAVVECMVRSFEQLAGLCTADYEVLTQLGLLRGAGLSSDDFAARADEYYLLMDSRCGAACAQSLHRSVRLAANLIVTAWIRAGSPAVIGVPAATPEPSPLPIATASSAAGKEAARAGDKAAAQLTTGSFVSSRKSKVYHRSDCAHAARINEANRAEYASLAEAQADGKRPCQTCRPDQPDAKKTG